MKKLNVFIVLWVLGFKALAQQDAQFSQYVFNGLYIDPAHAGYREQLYLQSIYRSQWAGIKGAPQSLAVAIDGASRNGNVGMGLMVSSDNIGAQSNLSAYANYAYRLRVNDNDGGRLSFGLGVGFVQLGIDGSKLDPVVAIDLAVPSGKQSTFYPDARAGIFYADDRFYLSFSVDNIVAHYFNSGRDRQILTPIPQPHFYLSGGTILSVTDDIKFRPTFLLKDDRGGPTNLDLNAFFLFNERLWIGTFYRTSVKLYDKNYLQNDLPTTNAMGIITEVFASDRLRIGYAFDYSLSKIMNYNYGSHELSIGIYFTRKGQSNAKCYF